MNINEFTKQPVIGIIRGIDKTALEPLVQTAVSAGLKTIEITMNTQNAPELISMAVKFARNRLTVGAGTVTSMDSLAGALNGGASFIVMPAMQREVVAYCVNNNIPVFPGAFTPLEIHNAWTAGATMVKVFPSQFFGPAYFKALKGPFDKIKLMACGGVNQSTIKDYFSNGADAVAFGASIFKKELIAKKDFISIENNIKSFLSALDCCTG